jgi:ABC-type Fe3+/spermidine/putrescine transport system ATPase subunit
LLSLEGIRKAFVERSKTDDAKEMVAVAGLSLEIKEGEFFTLLGPSGCGKTTTLRMVAGLEDPDRGRIQLNDSVFFDSSARVNVAPHRRHLGMVFQSYAIWPHMTCAKNVAFPLTRARARTRSGERWSKKAINDAVQRALDLVQLGHLASRPATDLSGGQQQRLALARALVADPPLMLLDEPLSNLDARLRDDMRIELKRMQRELGITTLYVTHDQSEALAMSSRIAVMNAGRLEQLGTPLEIYKSPRTKFVAEFIGQCNFLSATVRQDLGSGEWLLDTECGNLVVEDRSALAVGDEVTVSVRPENVIVESPPAGESSQPATRQGTLDAAAFLGDSVDYRIRVKDMMIRAKSHPSALKTAGSDVQLRLPKEWCTIVAHD